MRVSLRFQLIAVLVLLGTVLVATHWTSTRSMSFAQGALSTIYADRVVPLRDLKKVADAYAVAIVDATHKLRSGAFEPAAAEAGMRAARTEIGTLWRAYLATHLVAEEKQLVEAAIEPMRVADAAVDDLLALVSARDMAGVEQFAVDRLYQTIDPVSEAIAALIDVQVRVVERELEAVNADIADTLSLGLVLAGVAAVAMMVGIRVVVSGVAGPIRAMTDAMGRMASGDFDTPLTTLGRSPEIAAMARALGVFRQNGLDKRRLDNEQAEHAASERRAQAARERLQAEAAETVHRAAAGDFGHRIDATFGDAELDAFARLLNGLMETVDRGIGETARVMEALAAGDLSASMEGDFKGAYATLQADVRATVERLRSTVHEIQSVSATMRHDAGEIAEGAHTLSQRAESQAASLEEVAATMEQMSATVKANAESASSAARLSGEATDRAVRGSKVVEQAVAAMGAIEQGSSRIADIVTVIDGFAFQTNLLALNAAVEAARAGEAGRGFAVVATEVRTLAQRSADAARDIKALIAESGQQVTSGVRLVEETGDALAGIMEAIGRVSGTIETISQASREQASGVDEIAAAISNMDQITQQNSAMAEQSSLAVKRLAGQAASLEELIGFFSIKGDASRAFEEDRRADRAAARALAG